MSSYRFAMCYKNSFMLCSHAIYCTVTLPYPKFTFDHVHLLSMVLLFFLVGCTFHFVLLKRHLKAVFHSILFSVHILFIRILSIRILFSFVYFSFVYFYFGIVTELPETFSLFLVNSKYRLTITQGIC